MSRSDRALVARHIREEHMEERRVRASRDHHLQDAKRRRKLAKSRKKKRQKALVVETGRWAFWNILEVKCFHLLLVFFLYKVMYFNFLQISCITTFWK